MARRVLGFAGILTLTLYGVTAAGASPALAARQRTARTTTTTAPGTTTPEAPTSTTTTATTRPPRTTTTTTPPPLTRSLLTPVTPSSTAPDGSGQWTAFPAGASAGSLHNTIVFTYTASGGDLAGGTVTLTVPSNWTAPSTTTTSPAYTTASTGTRTISSRTITVSNINLTNGNSFTITYGDMTGGSPGVTAPSTPIAQSWATKEKSTPGGILTTGVPVAVPVTARDGAGTIAASTTTAVAGSTTNTISFTFTAPAGGLVRGDVTVLVPTGWTPPQTDQSGNPGYVVTNLAVPVDIAGQYISAFDLNMNPGDHLTITYGQTNGATAPSTTGPQLWQIQEYSSPGGIPTNLAAGSPTINVVSDSTTVVDPPAVSASSIHNTMVFTYTAPTGGLSSGAVTLTVPTGWSAPSVSGTQLGYSIASMGTLTVSTRTITVSGLTLAGGSTFTITYGYRGLGGAGATAPTTPIVQTWPVSEKATSGGTLIPATSPSVTVTAKDGTGTMTTPTKNVSASSTGNTIVFTFTAPAGGVTHGELTLQVPSGWSQPSTTSTDPGYFTASAGASTFIDGPRMGVFDFTLPAGQTLTISYGAKTGGGPGATAPSTPASLQKWQAAERSSLATSGALKSLLTSPTITVNAADGSGTMTITSPAPDPDPLSDHSLAVRAGSVHNTIVFTFKAPAGGMANGIVRLLVPPDWPAPSTDPADPGFTKSSLNNTTSPLVVGGQNITVFGVTKSVGSTFTITYGFKTNGAGQGATAPSVPGPETWRAQELSTGTGTLTNLAVSPSTLIPTHTIEASGVNGCSGTLNGGSGQFCFMPNGVSPNPPYTTQTNGTVIFANFTGATHDVDRCDLTKCPVDGGTGGDPNFGGSPDLHPGYQYTFTFDGTPGSAGTYNYFCSIHGYAVMHGTITVS